MLPFQIFIDQDGALNVCNGSVISVNATATVVYTTAGGGMLVDSEQRRNGNLRRQAARASGAVLVGGQSSGYVDVTSTATTVPVGVGRYLIADLNTSQYGGPLLTGPGQGPAAWYGIFSSGSGSVRDGYGVVVASGPWGAMAATSYGKTNYNGGAAFTMAGPVVVPVWPPLDLTLGGVDSNTLMGPWKRDTQYRWIDAGATGWALELNNVIFDGSGTIYDPAGHDVATRPATAGMEADPTGLWTASAGGMTYHSTATVVTTGRQTDGTWGDQVYALGSTAAGVQTWPGATTAAKKIVWNTSTGAAELRDASGVAMAVRAAASTTTVDGTYDATAAGIAAYGNGGQPWSLVVATSGKDPFLVHVGRRSSATTAGTAYVLLTLNGSSEVTAVKGPFFGASLPANTPTQVSIPLGTSDGAGNVSQLQIGAIVWRP